jgi:homocysteine S-methyltransferase
MHDFSRLTRLRAGETFVTDGGLETVLVFHDGLELPHFAAFDLLSTESGTARLRAYYEDFLRVAVDRGVGFVFEAPTWRRVPTGRSCSATTTSRLEQLLRAAVRLGADLGPPSRPSARRSSSAAASARAATATTRRTA